MIRELGIYVGRKLLVDELCSEDEQREKEVLKTIGMWTHLVELADAGIATINDHPRFEAAIFDSCSCTGRSPTRW